MNKDFFFKYSDESGAVFEYEMLVSFTDDETGREYILYTDNSHDDEGKLKIYAAIYSQEEAGIKLYPIETEQEWQIVERRLQQDIP